MLTNPTYQRHSADADPTALFLNRACVRVDMAMDVLAYIQAIEAQAREQLAVQATGRGGEIRNDDILRLPQKLRDTVGAKLVQDNQWIAVQLGLSPHNHAWWCRSQVHPGFVASQTVSRALAKWGEPHSVRSRIEDLVLEPVNNRGRMLRALVLDHPFVGLVAELAVSQFEHPKSPVNKIERTYQCSMTGWYLDFMREAGECYIAGQQLIEGLRARTNDSRLDTLLECWGQDHEQFLAEAVGLATTFAVAPALFRAPFPALTYWPLYNRPERTSIEQLKKEILPLTFKALLDAMPERFTKEAFEADAITIPTSVTISDLIEFVKLHKETAQLLHKAFSSPARQDPSNPLQLNAKYGVTVLIRERSDCRGQARIGFGFDDARFNGFSFRIDRDPRFGLTLDLNKLDYATGLKYARHKHAAVLKGHNIREMLTHDGHFKQVKGVNAQERTLQSFRNEVPCEIRYAVMAQILATCGHSVSTRRHEAVGHHHREAISGLVRADDFADMVTEFRGILLAGPVTSNA